jgi:hypothetical protein
MSLRVRVWLLLLATVVAWAPLVSVVTASAVTSLAGCELNEAGATPCVIGERDVGELLTTMFVLGWLMLATAPFMIATIVGWVLLAPRLGRAWRSGGDRPSSR